MDESLQLACFRVGGERYALDIMRVLEVTRWHPVTKIPKAPEFLEGVINLRGRVIPVVDLRKRLDLPPQEPTRRTRVLIAEIGGKVVGFIVDEAREVLRVVRGDVRPPPQIVRGVASQYLEGILQNGTELILILDFEKVLSTHEKIRLEEAGLGVPSAGETNPDSGTP